MKMTWAVGIALCVVGSSCSNGNGPGGLPVGDPQSLAGTWDATTTSTGGTPSMALVTIAQGSISITRGATAVTFNAEGTGAATLTWASSSIRTFTGTHSETGSGGSLPVNLLGDWTFSDAKGGLTASITDTKLSSNCTGSCGNPVTGSDFQGKITGTKTAPSAAASIFGDLAGTWHLADANGYACDVTFLNATVQASCGKPSTTPFTFTATLDGNVLSGTASNGTTYELSAQRR